MKKLKLGIFTIVVLLFTVFGLIQRSYADSFQQCGGNNPANAFVLLPSGTYDAYVKLGEKDKSEIAELSYQSIGQAGTDTGCVVLNKATVNHSTFTKLVSNIVIKGGELNVYLSSPSIKGNQTAAASQVIFVSSSSVPCNLSVDCTVMFEGQSMKLSPKKISLTSDSLIVGNLISINNEKIKKVIYSIDGKATYQSDKLEPFKERYVSGGEHILERQVLFPSGSTISDTRTIEKGTVADANYIIESVFFSQLYIIRITALLISGVLLLLTVKAGLRYFYKRRQWRKAHITGFNFKIDSKKTGPQANLYNESIFSIIHRYKKLLLWLLSILLGLIFTTTYVIGFFTVDGVSMLPTLKDRSIHLIIKLPKTIATINKSDFIPKRGEIVVLMKDENNLFDPQAASLKSYVVKRVIALPEERVVVKNGVVTVFNKEHSNGFVPDDVYKWVKNLTGSEDFNIDLTLKAGQVFVMGDHRNESIDSRFYGPVNVKDIVGKVIQ